METYQTLQGTQLQQIDNNNYFSILPDGRRLQLTQMLYYLLTELQIPLNIQQITLKLQDDLGLETEHDELLDLLDNVLVSQGLLHKNGSSPPEVTVAPEPNPTPVGITDLHLQIDIISKEYLQPITNILQVLFQLPVAFILMIAIVATQIAVLREIRSISDLHFQFNQMPSLFIFILLTTIFHELGHLSACRKGGAQHGAIGIGIYFFAPVFYADVTEAWNLPRIQRIIVNLGGIYFQLILTPILLALYLATDNSLYLWMILVTYWLIVVNLNPIIKLDGYWIVSDALKIPNLHKRSAELLSFIGRWFFNKIRHPQESISMPPFLAKLAPYQTFSLTLYVTMSLTLVVIAIRIAIPLIIAQISIAPLVIEAFIERFPAINLTILAETIMFLAIPVFILITLAVLAYRFIATLRFKIGAAKS